MFREVQRKKQALPREVCIDLLKTQLRGVLSVLGDDGYPYGMPLNHYYCPEDGKLYFHSGKTGHKLDAMAREPRVSYCVMDGGTREEGDWALTFRSVIVFGRVEPVTDRARIYDIARRLSYRFTHDESYIAYELEHSGPGTFMFALTPEHITGKVVHEK